VSSIRISGRVGPSRVTVGSFMSRLRPSLVDAIQSRPYTATDVIANEKTLEIICLSNVNVKERGRDGWMDVRTAGDNVQSCMDGRRVFHCWRRIESISRNMGYRRGR